MYSAVCDMYSVFKGCDQQVYKEGVPRRNNTCLNSKIFSSTSWHIKETGMVPRWNITICVDSNNQFLENMYHKFYYP